MSLQIRNLLLSSAVALISLAVHAGGVWSADPKNPFRKEIQLPELKEKQLVAISPDSDLFHNGNGTFGEVRIIDEGGRTQPVTDWKAKVPTAIDMDGIVSFADVQLENLPDGTTELRFRLPPNFAKIHNVFGVHVMPRCENFEVHGKVFGVRPRPVTADANRSVTADANRPVTADATKSGSADANRPVTGEAKEARTLLSEGDLADYRGFLPLSQLDIPVKFGDYPEYVLVLDRPTFKDEPKLISLALDWGFPVREPNILDRGHFINLWAFLGTKGQGTMSKTKYITGSPRSMKVTQDPTTAMTIVDIETGGEPMISISPIFAEKDYFRTCAVYVDRSSGSGDPQWDRIAEGDLRKIHYKNLSDENLEVGFQENTAKKYRLKIDNSYLPPLEVREVKFKYPERELVFFAEPGQKLWVEYGDKTWIQPVEYVGPIQILLNKGTTPAVATLGPEEAWESPSPLFYLLKQPLLWGGVGVGCLIVFIIFKYLEKKTIEKTAY